jgi:3-oxoacyl-[acyl-carrier protein] reductase
VRSIGIPPIVLPSTYKRIQSLLRYIWMINKKTGNAKGGYKMSLDGKVVLVTGSGRNIGRSTILEMARRGANVVINVRSNLAEAESVAEEANRFGVRSLVAVSDVGDQDQVQSMVDRIKGELGPVDILINNAGLRASNPIRDITVDRWREVMATNLDAPFFCSQAVIPDMMDRGWGRIINISGLNAFKGNANWAHVCASKMGALGLTRALSVELAPYNILVNHIVPGAFDTTPASSDSRQATMTSSQRATGIPLGRLGLPEEIAKTCAFLASDDASFITGQSIHVNGGALNY